MTWQAATFPAVTAFDRHASASAGYRRTVCRSVGIGLGTVTTVGLMAGTAAVAAAWIVATALHGAPHPRAPLALQTAGFSPASGDSADSAPFPAPPAAERGKGPKLRAPFLRARVEESIQALHDIARVAAAPALPQVEAAPSSGLIAAAFDLFDPEPAYTAALPVAPAAAPQLPQHRLAERAVEAPSPSASAQTVSSTASPLQPQRDAASAAAKPALPQVAALAPAPPSALSNFMHKLFGARPAPAASPVIADSDGHTAIYDIEAHTVYLPNGERLEAHSGLGSMLDDPHYIDKKARGPTPPNVYDLALRDGLFHGVQAIRLNPVNDDKMFGRDGILAHPYMLGPTGQSFGCVSFKDYSEFLQAFERGEVDRLVVVRHLETTVSDAAPPRRQHDKRFAAND